MSTSPARVVIVMRTKDRGLLLDRALRDVVGQTFDGWRLVVVNDGGDPGVVDDLLASHAQALAGRATVLHNPESTGMEAASNRGITESASEFLAVHDDDDTWHPEFLQRTVAYLDAHPAEHAVTVRTEIVWEHIDGDAVHEDGREIFEEGLAFVTLFDLLRVNRFVPISLLYRREVHDRVGLYREDLPAVGDWEFHLRLALDHDIAFIDGEPLAYWHQRRDQGGDLGNSVQARHHEHLKYDQLLRDEHLRAYVREHGLGAMLYLTRYLQAEIDHLHRRMSHQEWQNDEVLRGLARVEAAVSDASVVSLLRRRYRAARHRARDRRAVGGTS